MLGRKRRRKKPLLSSKSALYEAPNLTPLLSPVSLEEADQLEVLLGTGREGYLCSVPGFQSGPFEGPENGFKFPKTTGI